MPAQFSLRLALSWTVLATAALYFALTLAFVAFPRGGDDIVLLGAVQVLVYAGMLAAFQRVQGEPLRDVLALRKTSLATLLSSALLGFFLQIPATLLSDAIEHFFPTPPTVLAERMARITPHSTIQAFAIVLVVAGLGPLVEEFFFRGALFGALRHSYGALVTALTVAVCFAFAHLDARLFFPLFITALALGEVRERSGSIWPGVALHAAFNGATLAAIFSGASPDGKPPRMPVFAALFGCLICILLLGTARRLALSSRVAQNRSPS
ncbi:MAG TPA: type II CAAX endopeptidase family protein [Polyangiaceae bacterium]|jgi:membrane protease YdiL (CAAX protease family)|nr:type II CAAX endopeptidase family protein [Polyangiaceae bacterium]